MPYINERISAEDRAKYKIDELELRYKRLFALINRGEGWTIDRDTDNFLILIKTGLGFDGESGIWYFVFYWQGIEILAKTKILAYGGKRDAPQWCRYGLLQIDIDDDAPEDHHQRFKRDYDAMIVDFKQALIAYKDFGILSNSTQHEAIFDF